MDSRQVLMARQIDREKKKETDCDMKETLLFLKTFNTKTMIGMNDLKK